MKRYTDRQLWQTLAAVMIAGTAAYLLHFRFPFGSTGGLVLTLAEVPCAVIAVVAVLNLRKRDKTRKAKP